LLFKRLHECMPDKTGGRPVLPFRGAFERGPQTGIDRDGKLLATLLKVSHALCLKSSDETVPRVRHSRNVPLGMEDFAAKSGPKILG
jgi:hypothetical protein